MPALVLSAVQTALDVSRLAEIADRMRCLMLRNIATDGYRFSNPYQADMRSAPGCIIASPSYPEATPGTNQDYVHNWTRDAALTAMELEAQRAASGEFARDYVTFAALCLAAAKAADQFDYACFNVDGSVRRIPTWSRQSDGPALQTLALIALWRHFDADDDPIGKVASGLVAENVEYLLRVYGDETVTLWEEGWHKGHSFFARAVQLGCFRAIADNTIGIARPDGLNAAIGDLEDALKRHWNGQLYTSLESPASGFDPNIDIVLASLYGAVPTTDPRLLATAARLRTLWADPGSDRFYPINGDDRGRGIGPLLGRYADDDYDGDGNHTGECHPWALSTCAFAELCYRVAADVAEKRAPTGDPDARPFFAQVCRPGADAQDDKVAQLRDAGDAMLEAVVFHSDHLELGEQFDAWTGYGRSVRNLTWSYSAFLSAVRARAAIREV